MNRNGSVDFETAAGPVPNPIAIVKIGMTRVSVTNKRFVVASAGAQRASPAGVTIVLGIDVAPPDKVRLFGAIDSSRDVPQRMGIGIDKPMAGRDITRGPHAQRSQPRSARMRLINSLAQLRQRVTDVGESMGFAAQGTLQVLVRQSMELLEHAIHAPRANGIELIRRSGHGRKPNFVKA